MRIFHPRPEIGRQHFIGVDFHGGIAEVDELHPERRIALEQHGFAIQDDDGSVSIPGNWPLPLPEAPPSASPAVAAKPGKPKPGKPRKPVVDDVEADVAATPAEAAILEEWAADLRAPVDSDEV